LEKLDGLFAVVGLTFRDFILGLQGRLRFPNLFALFVDIAEFLFGPRRTFINARQSILEWADLFIRHVENYVALLVDELPLSVAVYIGQAFREIATRKKCSWYDEYSRPVHKPTALSNLNGSQPIYEIARMLSLCGQNDLVLSVSANKRPLPACWPQNHEVGFAAPPHSR
jgi:hypothetical protein